MSCWCHVDVMVMLLFLISYLRSIKVWAVLEPKSFWTHLKSPPGCEWGPWWRDCRDCVLEHFAKEKGKILCTVKWMGRRRNWREITRNSQNSIFLFLHDVPSLRSSLDYGYLRYQLHYLPAIPTLGSQMWLLQVNEFAWGGSTLKHLTGLAGKW